VATVNQNGVDVSTADVEPANSEANNRQ